MHVHPAAAEIDAQAPDANVELRAAAGAAHDPCEATELRRAFADERLPELAIRLVDYILRSRTLLFDQVHGQRDLARTISTLAVLAAALLAAYGLVMGSYNGPLQAVSSAVKLPVLFLLAAASCVPALYVSNVLLGQNLRFLQILALQALSIATTAIVLASLAPLTLVFTLTGGNYAFLKLMHVFLLGLAGAVGIRFLQQGLQFLAGRSGTPIVHAVLRTWIVLYAIVGTQLAWRLRPYLGALDRPFQLLRDSEGNFYKAVLDALRCLAG
jgi:hypothetical protein